VPNTGVACLTSRPSPPCSRRGGLSSGRSTPVLFGELGLDGRVHPVRDILPAALAAQQAGLTRVIVPLRQAGEAKLVAGIEVFGIASISQLVVFLQGEPLPPVDPIEVIGDGATSTLPLSGPGRCGWSGGGQVGCEATSQHRLTTPRAISNRTITDFDLAGVALSWSTLPVG
jgi:Subunit ChlI of Mg-chelatase